MSLQLRRVTQTQLVLLSQQNDSIRKNHCQGLSIQKCLALSCICIYLYGNLGFLKNRDTYQESFPVDASLKKRYNKKVEN